MSAYGSAGRQAHILKRLGEIGAFFFFDGVQCRDVLADTGTHTRIGAVGNHRFDIFCADMEFMVEYSIRIRLQGFPVDQFFVPGVTGGGEASALHILEGDFIRGDETTTGAHFDGHIADGHAGFHGEASDGGAGVFNKVAGSAGSRDQGNDVQDNVFGKHPFVEIAFHIDAHQFGFGLQQALGGQHHFHFAGTDAEGDGTEGAVCRGMAIATYHGHTRLGDAQFGADHMNDTLKRMTEPIKFDAEVSAVFFEGIYLFAGEFLANGQVLIDGWYVMIGCGHHLLGAEHVKTAFGESFKSLGGGNFMNEVFVDIQYRWSPFNGGHQMFFPDLFK